MSSFLEELKRRKVVRVAMVYAATGYVVLEAADLILPRLGVPEWALTLVVVLLLLGFPVALALAWALEVTRDGVRVTTARADHAATPDLFGKRTLVLSAMLVMLGIGLSAGWFLRPVPSGVPARATLNDRSVAVLPFADFTPGGEQAWFSDGLAEEILNALARLPDVRVVSRTGSFRFRGSDLDVRAIADSLHVAHILEGSVRRSGEQVRITAQLIRASDDTHLWSQTFDRNAGDVIRVQEEIAFEIARTLRSALEPDALARMVAAGTNSLSAYEAFLRYQHLLHRSTEAEDWRIVLQAADAIEEARTADPQFSRAHVAAAQFWIDQITPSSRWTDVTDLPYREKEQRALERLRAAASTATDSVDRLRAERGQAMLQLRLREAFTLSRRIAQLSGTGQAWYELGDAAKAVGEYDVARNAFRRAAERADEIEQGALNLPQEWHRVEPEAALAFADTLLPGLTKLDDIYQMHRVLLAAGRVERAATLAEQYVARSGDSNGRIVVRLRQLCGEGRTAEARALYDSLGGDSITLMTRWHALVLLGPTDAVVDLLRPMDRAGELFPLSTFLNYTFFDARLLPNLAAALRRNGALRETQLPLPYACPTAGGAPSSR